MLTRKGCIQIIRDIQHRDKRGADFLVGKPLHVSGSKSALAPFFMLKANAP